MLSRTLQARAAAGTTHKGISISAAALAAASARLAPDSANNSIGVPSTSTAAGGVTAVPSSSSSSLPSAPSTKADRVASATATVDRLMRGAAGGGGGGGGSSSFDLGLDFTKMDFKKIAEDTQQAIARERLGVRLPNVGGGGSGNAVGGSGVIGEEGQAATQEVSLAPSDLAARYSSVTAGRGGGNGGGRGSYGNNGRRGGFRGGGGANSSERQHASNISGGGDGAAIDPYYDAPNPNRPGSVIEKLRDFKLASDWEGALTYFTNVVTNQNEFRRWHIQHIRILIDLLAMHGKMTELWKVWRLARATEKLVEVNESVGNAFLHRFGRLALLTAVVGDEQLASWWVQLVRDTLKLLETHQITLDPKNEATVKAALSAEEPQTAIRNLIDAINTERGVTTSADGSSPSSSSSSFLSGRGGGGRGGRGGGRGRGGGGSSTEGDVRRAARSAFHRQVMQHAHGNGAAAAAEGNTPSSLSPDSASDAHHSELAAAQQPHHHRPPADPTNTLELNEALTFAKSTAEVEHLLTLALERNIEFNDETFAKRIQRLGLRRREAFRKQREGWASADGAADGGGAELSGEASDWKPVPDSEEQSNPATTSDAQQAATSQEASPSNDDAASAVPPSPDAPLASSSSLSPAAAETTPASAVSKRQAFPSRAAEHAPLDAEILAEAKRLFHEANVYANRAKNIQLFDPDLTPEMSAAMAPEVLLGMHVKVEGGGAAVNNDGADTTSGDEESVSSSTAASSSFSSPSSLPSTSLCNALLYELRKSNSFEDLRLVEAMMRGPDALIPQAGRFWRISPSSKTVDHLISAYYRAGFTDRCKELFDEMKVNYAARLSPLVYTTMIKIQSDETAPKRDPETGNLIFPQRVLPKGVTPRMAAIHAHQELGQLIHQLAADGADRRINDNASIALINKWAQSRRRR